MATLQTSLQNADDIILESGQIEISIDSASTWIDLGLADNVAVTFNSTPREVQPGNGATPDIAKGSASQMVSLSADLWELSMTNMVDISGGLFTKTVVAGAPLVDETDVYAADATEVNKFYPFATQQGTGVVPTAIAIEDDTPNTYVLDDSYQIIKVGAKWGYRFISGGTPAYDPTAVITVTYTVTPNISEKISVGGTSSQTSIMIRISNLVKRTDVAYDILNQWIIYNAFVEGDIAVALKNKDEADAVARIPLTLKGSLDDSRTAGDQLYSFERTKVAH